MRLRKRQDKLTSGYKVYFNPIEFNKNTIKYAHLILKKIVSVLSALYSTNIIKPNRTMTEYSVSIQSIITHLLSFGRYDT